MQTKMGPSGLVGLVIWDVPALSLSAGRRWIDPTTTAPVVPHATSDAAEPREGLVADGDAARGGERQRRPSFPFPAADCFLNSEPVLRRRSFDMELESGLDGACTVPCKVIFFFLYFF